MKRTPKKRGPRPGANRIAGKQRNREDSIPTRSAGQASRPISDGDRPVRHAASYVDEKIIAELAWNRGEAQPDFIGYNRRTRKANHVSRLDTPNGAIEPPESWQGIVTPGGPVIGMVFVPTDCIPNCRGKKLWKQVADFINRYVELPKNAVELAVAYVFLTWVFDVFAEIPYLAFRALASGRGKSRALGTVGAICYRPMFCGGGSTAASTLRLLDMFCGTLVADEFDQHHHTELAASLTRILNQGFQRGRPLLKCVGDEHKTRSFQCFGPKVFAFRHGFGDDATESRTLSIRMEPRTRDAVPINLPPDRFDREARTLRNRLLTWRFTNYASVKLDPKLANKNLEDRLNQIGLPLFAVARHEDARAAIRKALQNTQDRIMSDRMDTSPGRVWQAVVSMAGPGDRVRPGEVAAQLNKLGLNDVGLSPETVGRVLKKELELLGKQDGKGTFYTLRPERFSDISRRFGMASVKTATTAKTARKRLSVGRRRR